MPVLSVLCCYIKRHCQLPFSLYSVYSEPIHWYTEYGAVCYCHPGITTLTSDHAIARFSMESGLDSGRIFLSKEYWYCHLTAVCGVRSLRTRPGGERHIWLRTFWPVSLVQGCIPPPLVYRVYGVSQSTV